MNKFNLILIFLVCSGIGMASSLPKLPISKLTDKSDLIVLAQVLSVTQDSSLDIVKIKIVEYIKGKTDTDTIQIALQVRGGLKEFDPQLKINDVGVFYLRKTSNGYASAHGGSISLFTKPYVSPSF